MFNSLSKPLLDKHFFKAINSHFNYKYIDLQLFNDVKNRLYFSYIEIYETANLKTLTNIKIQNHSSLTVSTINRHNTPTMRQLNLLSNRNTDTNNTTSTQTNPKR